MDSHSHFDSGTPCRFTDMFWDWYTLWIPKHILTLIYCFDSQTHFNIDSQCGFTFPLWFDWSKQHVKRTYGQTKTQVPEKNNFKHCSAAQKPSDNKNVESFGKYLPSKNPSSRIICNVIVAVNNPQCGSFTMIQGTLWPPYWQIWHKSLFKLIQPCSFYLLFLKWQCYESFVRAITYKMGPSSKWSGNLIPCQFSALISLLLITFSCSCQNFKMSYQELFSANPFDAEIEPRSFHFHLE